MGGLDEVRVSLAPVASGLGVAHGARETKQKRDAEREKIGSIHAQLRVVDRILQ